MLNLKKDFNYSDGLIYTNICDKLEDKKPEQPKETKETKKKA
jgi:hypothetical protein